MSSDAPPDWAPGTFRPHRVPGSPNLHFKHWLQYKRRPLKHKHNIWLITGQEPGAVLDTATVVPVVPVHPCRTRITFCGETPRIAGKPNQNPLRLHKTSWRSFTANLQLLRPSGRTAYHCTELKTRWFSLTRATTGTARLVTCDLCWFRPRPSRDCKKATSISLYFFISQESQV